jgi:hypothetical protein
VAAGAANRRKQIANIRLDGVPAVVTINAFPTDHASEHEIVRQVAAEESARAAVSTHFSDGGRGAVELAEAVEEATAEPSDYHVIYPDSASLRDKIHAVATIVYGADGVEYSALAAKQLGTYERAAFGHRPVCIAKPPVQQLGPVAQGRADRMDLPGPRSPCLRRRRVCLPDLRGHAHHAGPVSPPRSRPHRPRSRRPDCGAVLTASQGDGGGNPASLLDQPVREFLDRVAACVPAPAAALLPCRRPWPPAWLRQPPGSPPRNCLRSEISRSKPTGCTAGLPGLGEAAGQAAGSRVTL